MKDQRDLINQFLTNFKEKNPMQPVIIMMMPPGYSNQFNAQPMPIPYQHPSHTTSYAPLPYNVHRPQRRKADRHTQIIRSTPYSKRDPKPRLQKASELVTLPDPLPEYIVPIKESDGLYCNTCQVNVNSKAQLKQHMNSTKHKMIEMGLIRKETPNCTRVGQYKCTRCDVMLNSEAQLMQHLGSLRHQIGPVEPQSEESDDKTERSSLASSK